MTRCEQLGDFIAGSGQVLAELRVRLHLPDSFGRDIAPGIDIALPFGVANQTAPSPASRTAATVFDARPSAVV